MARATRYSRSRLVKWSLNHRSHFTLRYPGAKRNSAGIVPLMSRILASLLLSGTEWYKSGPCKGKNGICVMIFTVPHFSMSSTRYNGHSNSTACDSSKRIDSSERFVIRVRQHSLRSGDICGEAKTQTIRLYQIIKKNRFACESNITPVQPTP